MALDPMLSTVVLALLGLFLVATFVKSVLGMVKRVVIVGVLVAVLLGTGTIQAPDVPLLGDMAGQMEPTVTGFLTGSESGNSTNITDAGTTVLDELFERVK